MIPAFEFATATRILFGAGRVREIGSLAAGCGKRALLVTGRSADRGQMAADLLAAANIEAAGFAVAGEPTLDTVRRGVARAREAGCDFVVSIGGGGAIDAGKAIAGLLANGGDPLDYVEIIGPGKALARPAMPFIAVPTTAGTGSEVTRNAVLGSPEHGVKVSLRSPRLLPRVALVDPVLTHELPPAITAATGLDALTQLIEPFVSGRANPITDALCRDGLRRAAGSLPRVVANGADATARADMALASLFGGLALANAGLGAVHGFAAAIGGLYPGAPHGAVCAALLAPVMTANVQALQQRDLGHPALARYHELARLLTGLPGAKTADGIAHIRQLAGAFGIPALSHYGVASRDADRIVAAATQASSMKGNPIALTAAELRHVLASAT